MIIYDSSINLSKGDVAQMVEYSLSMRRVQGSIPCFSIHYFLVSRVVFDRPFVRIPRFFYWKTINELNYFRYSNSQTRQFFGKKIV